MRDWAVAVPLALGLLLGAIAFAGCEATSGPLTVGKPGITIQEQRHFRIGTAKVAVWRIVTACNPTGEDMLLECHGFIWRVAPRTWTKGLLTAADKGCDYHNDVTYGPAIPVEDVQTINGELRRAP